jgi:hypothetical protein
VKPFDRLAEYAKVSAGDEYSYDCLLHRLMIGSFWYISRAGRESLFNETVESFGPEEWTPDLLWSASEIVGERMRAAEEMIGMGRGITLGDLEMDEIESYSDEESVLENWSSLLADIDHETNPELMAKAEDLCDDYFSTYPDLMKSVAQRLNEKRSTSAR